MKQLLSILLIAFAMFIAVSCNNKNEELQTFENYHLFFTPADVVHTLDVGTLADFDTSGIGKPKLEINERNDGTYCRLLEKNSNVVVTTDDSFNNPYVEIVVYLPTSDTTFIQDCENYMKLTPVYKQYNSTKYTGVLVDSAKFEWSTVHTRLTAWK
jgi:hypothetical protein